MGELNSYQSVRNGHTIDALPFEVKTRFTGLGHSNSAIAELETADSPENTALSAIWLLTVRVSTPRSP
ncbi:MAG: hypothetical protein ACE5HN_09630, partial [Nitrospiria bacterium]